MHRSSSLRLISGGRLWRETRFVSLQSQGRGGTRPALLTTPQTMPGNTHTPPNPASPARSAHVAEFGRTCVASSPFVLHPKGTHSLRTCVLLISPWCVSVSLCVRLRSVNVVFSLTTGVLYIAAEVAAVGEDVDLVVNVAADAGGAYRRIRAIRP